ncbi:peptidase M15 [Motiliproteus coralliicola]|uniref:Peptidase M15 n=1 Tax=Motiliproteus coralliicola TaxID=2283196 RepID=A0A369WSP9_9GAMM|nr:peptidase M15 [Motiliproteus coralliicola]
MSYQYFPDYELECKCGCGAKDMDPEFMYRLIRLRDTLGFPFPVSSAFRCAKHNRRVSRTGMTGPHTTGRAVDIRTSGERAWEIFTEAKRFGFTGIGVRQHGPFSQRIVHLDDLTAPEFPRPRIWSYKA